MLLNVVASPARLSNPKTGRYLSNQKGNIPLCTVGTSFVVRPCYVSIAAVSMTVVDARLVMFNS